MTIRNYNFNQPINFRNFALRDFLGVDFSHDPSEVATQRSPDSKNMISGFNGVIEKRQGYTDLQDETMALTGKRINGVYAEKWTFGNVDHGVFIVHAGTELYSAVRKITHTGAWNVATHYMPDDTCTYGGILYICHNESEGTLPTNTDFFIAYDGKPLLPSTYTKMQYMNPTLDGVPGSPQYVSLNDVKSKFIMLQNDEHRYKVLCFGAGKLLVITIRDVYSSYSVDFAIDILTQPQYSPAYVPTTVIARAPSGGGEAYEEINILSRARKNSFLGTAATTLYVVQGTIDDVVNLDPYGNDMGFFNGKVYVQVLQSGGNWLDLEEGVAFTVNRTTSTINFAAGSIPFGAPGVSPVTGMDNVVIRYCSRNTTSESQLVDSCVYAMYGLNGREDYMFLAGNFGKDFYGRFMDLYFGELGYAFFGDFQARIVGYSRIGEYLVVHKDSEKSGKTLYLRSASVDSNQVLTFPMKQGVSGVGSLSSGAFNVLRDEPLWLSEYGVNALVSNNITGVQAVQDRSYYINKRLLAEPLEDLMNAESIVFDNKYFLAIGDHVYVADSRRKYQEKNAYSESFQYEWYFWELPDVETFFVYDNQLYFGTSTGKLRRFKQTWERHCYMDNDTPVTAYWNTPVINFNDITSKKSLKNLWIRMVQYTRSGVKVYYKVRGDLKLVKDKKFDMFDFDDIDFTRFTFETEADPEVIVTNRVERQFMSIQFKLLNDADENFGLIEMVARYKTNSAYRGG